MTTIVTLAAGDPDPIVATDRGVSLFPARDRADHAPDRHIALLDGASLVGRCSCWWTAAPQRLGERFGVIGHYAAANQAAGAILLARACETLAAAGCTVAAGPMDGNTWRRYRFVTERGDAPPFFLEPDNPDDWPDHWTSAGFTPLATYTSALNDDLATAGDRSDAAREKLAAAGITVTTLDPGRAEDELRRIHALSLLAFSRNFLYTPIAETEFLAQYGAVLPVVRPELVLLAERDHELIGFIFAIPDMLQAYRGEIVDTVILKTMAVHPSVSGMGLGGLLMDDVQRAAREQGFRRAIHALMHEDNRSQVLSTRYARTFRRYTLLSRLLQPPTHPD